MFHRLWIWNHRQHSMLSVLTRGCHDLTMYQQKCIQNFNSNFCWTCCFYPLFRRSLTSLTYGMYPSLYFLLSLSLCLSASLSHYMKSYISYLWFVFSLSLSLSLCLIYPGCFLIYVRILYPIGQKSLKISH